MAEGLGDGSSPHLRFGTAGLARAPRSGRITSPELGSQPLGQSSSPSKLPPASISPFPAGPSGASPRTPALPLPVSGAITLENLYEYFVARSDHSDALNRRLLAQNTKNTTTLLRGIYLDLAKLQAKTVELSSVQHQMAEGWSDRQSKRPAFVDALNRAEVRSSEFPYLVDFRTWNADLA